MDGGVGMRVSSAAVRMMASLPMPPPFSRLLNHPTGIQLQPWRAPTSAPVMAPIEFAAPPNMTARMIASRGFSHEVHTAHRAHATASVPFTWKGSLRDLRTSLHRARLGPCCVHFSSPSMTSSNFSLISEVRLRSFSLARRSAGLTSLSTSPPSTLIRVLEMRATAAACMQALSIAVGWTWVHSKAASTASLRVSLSQYLYTKPMGATRTAPPLPCDPSGRFQRPDSR
mmetsp:Transcript_8531/g.24477  ORF Transcript_8531/g.24477 Transcript_8531/m.24477 type:complete len:228 (-) Transcript_8531:791-1474(-)